MDYEYQIVKLKDEWRSDIECMKLLGQQGWEAIELITDELSPQESTKYAWMLLRKKKDISLFEIWEYKINSTLHSNYSDHLVSCGWEKIEKPYHIWIYPSSVVAMHFLRRRRSFGDDDGDIENRLEKLEIPHGWNEIDQILELKWQLSQEEGRNIGTDMAIEYWIRHGFMRRCPVLIPPQQVS